MLSDFKSFKNLSLNVLFLFLPKINETSQLKVCIQKCSSFAGKSVAVSQDFYKRVRRCIILKWILQFIASKGLCSKFFAILEQFDCPSQHNIAFQKTLTKTNSFKWIFKFSLKNSSLILSLMRSIPGLHDNNSWLQPHQYNPFFQGYYFQLTQLRIAYEKLSTLGCFKYSTLEI